MLLHHCTWPEVEDYLTRSKGIIIPIGSTEQHGPNGLIGTDAICAEAVALRVGEATGALVSPGIPVGMATHHMAFPGSMTLRPSTLLALLGDWVLSLSRHGFERFFFVNGHGGNIASLRAAFSEIHADNLDRLGNNAPYLRLQLCSWWDNGDVMQLSRKFYGGAEGSHATPSEVAVTQFLLPDTIKQVRLDPEIAPGGGFHDARDYRKRHPDGRIGSAPGRARPDHGAQLLDAATNAITRQYLEFINAG